MDVFPLVTHSKWLRCSKYRILNYTAVLIGSEDSCKAESRWPFEWVLLMKIAPWQSRSQWPSQVLDGWQYFKVWDRCMITLNTDAWSLFRTLAGMRGRCLSDNAARPAHQDECVARPAEWRWQYVSKAAMRAVLHDYVIIVGSLDHVKHCYDVLMLQRAVDEHFLSNRIRHIGIVLNFLNKHLHCDLSMTFTAAQICVASSRHRNTFPDAPAPSGWSKCIT